MDTLPKGLYTSSAVNCRISSIDSRDPPQLWQPQHYPRSRSSSRFKVRALFNPALDVLKRMLMCVLDYLGLNAALFEWAESYDSKVCISAPVTSPEETLYPSMRPYLPILTSLIVLRSAPT